MTVVLYINGKIQFSIGPDFPGYLSAAGRMEALYDL